MNINLASIGRTLKQHRDLNAQLSDLLGEQVTVVSYICYPQTNAHLYTFARPDIARKVVRQSRIEHVSGFALVIDYGSQGALSLEILGQGVF